MDQPRTPPPHHGPETALPPAFDHALQFEILGSDLLRARTLAALFGVGLAAALLTRYTPGLPPQYAFGSPPSLIVIGAIIFLALYETGMAGWIRKLRADRSTPQPWVWYANALVELTTPTLAMLAMARYLDEPVFALATPTVLVYFGFVALSTLRLDPAFSAFTGLIAAVQYVALSLFLLGRFPPALGVDPLFSSIHFPVQRAVILTTVGIGCGFVASELRRRVSEALTQVGENRRILTVFGQQTSPEVAAALLKESPDISESRFVCVLFLDIRAFSTFAESRDPEAVVEYLNTLFEFSIAAVHRRHGHVHQLLGDGFMAIFGAPVSHGNDCANAVDAALEIIAQLAQAIDSKRIDPTEIGIGIHAGQVIAGSVGSSLHREYKVTGDAVNVAARVEGLTKTMGGSLLITQAVWDRLDEPKPIVLARQELALRGRKQPVQVLQLA